MSYKDISIFSSCGCFIQQSGTVAILAEDIMGKISMNYLEFGPVVKEMSLKDFFLFLVWWPLSFRRVKPFVQFW